MKAIIRIVTLILLLPIAAHAGEAERRAFFEPENRALKFQSADAIFPARTVRAGRQVWKLGKSSKARAFDPR